MDYLIVYDNNYRILKITFMKEFPYEIVEWEEVYKSGSGEDAIELKTHAKFDKRIILDYWKYNKNKDGILREKLGLAN